MGAPKRRRKLYESPKKLWDKTRIEEESKLVQEYGLKNMRELWRMQTLLRKIRREARRLLSRKGLHVEERTASLLKRAKNFLVRNPEATLDDLLTLSIRDMLERRLETLIYKKHFAKTLRQSRQLIVHGHIAINGSKVTIPSYIVKFAEEDQIGWYGQPVDIEAGSKPEPKKVEKKASAPAVEAPAQEAVQA